MALTLDKLERLLNDEEGATLDFKRTQYPFDEADDTAKSELLKDILAFANTPRQEPAYVLIGVDDVKGGRSRITGVDRHLDDAKLQQFVNSKTNRIVTFSYQPLHIEDREIGVIEIPVQERPIYLRTDFGKLGKEKVYLRHGSSTAVASPDEIVEMGNAPMPQSDSEQTRTYVQQRLIGWHRTGEKRFLQLTAGGNSTQWHVPVKDHRYQFSYLISTGDNETLGENSIKQVLKKVAIKVCDTVSTGYSMFEPIGDEVYVVPDEHIGTGEDVFEFNLTSLRDSDLWFPDFWRVAPDGRTTLVRAYREDRDGYGGRAGAGLSPEILMREITEFVTHSRWFAERFENPMEVFFRCSWNGLENRRISYSANDLNRYEVSPKVNQRTTEGIWSVSELARDWSAIVAELGCPILRLFGCDDCDQAYVESLAPKFVIRPRST